MGISRTEKQKQKQERLGEIGYNNDGDRMVIIEYNNAMNIVVEFQEGYTKQSTYKNFKMGTIENPYRKIKIKKSKIGETNVNAYGSIMTIIDYNNSQDVTIQFDNGYIKYKVVYYNFKTGKVKSPYCKTVYGVGYLGEGKYKPCIGCKNTIQYSIWLSMFEVAYSERLHKKYPTYIGCTVDERWHNFQVFADWFDKNHYEIEGEVICLDKDILVKGNKVYSPETVIFTPQRINNLFCKSDNKRGYLPIGVRLDKRFNRYMCEFGNGKNKRYFAGYFNDPIDAFYEYRKYKKIIIKEMADEYKGKIPQRLYESLCLYEIEITD